MLWWLIPTILIVISLVVSLVIVVRKIPQLRIMDVLSLPEEKFRQVKEFLLQQRFQRVAKERFGFLINFGAKAWKESSRQGRRLMQKVYSIEQHYRKMQKASAPVSSDAETIRKMMEEAEALVGKEEYFEAEKIYIEILSQFPKHVKAYEALGNLYVLDRKYNQARETFNFALKLKQDDASIHTALGELEMKENNPTLALAEFAKAIEIRPNSPRYLDFFIESAIAAKNVAEAKRGVEKLREVNPDNQKIVDFDERIAVLANPEVVA
jgi:tetratricopeptide (TPR) repeat protein